MIFSLLIGFNFSCEKQILDANTIINQSIEVSGGERFKMFNIEFDFRNKHYLAKHNHGAFLLERISVKGNDSIFDKVTNTDFKRFVNEEQIELPDSMAVKYSASVNSVHYFSVLPMGLNAKAVNKEYVAEVLIKGERYHKIKVTFNPDGGGEDFDDVFLYWIHGKTKKVDYLAYSYHESDGLGVRFREAYNERYVNGIRFVDYNNYKPISKQAVLFNLDVLFDAGKLELLSKIELEAITVNY